MRKLLLLSILLLATVLTSHAQNLAMPTSGSSSFSRCGNVVRDSGGTGDYSHNESGVMTICPATAGTRVTLTFTMVDLDNNDDFLRIYDGNTTGATLIATITGNVNPGVVIASLGNPTGCLTLSFSSDGAAFLEFGNNYNGFEANISCSCQQITSSITSITPAAVSGIVQGCQNQSIAFTGTGAFTGISTGATYLWSFGDGTTAAGQSVSHAYTGNGQFMVNLQITDVAGCTNTNLQNQRVRIAPPPTLSSSATPATLCTNGVSALAATVTMNPNVINCTPPVSGVTFLPDGSGVSYTTSIAVSCYDATAVISSPADFSSICMNIEHSYLGDLGISLTCPNGNSVFLKTNPGGGSANLGFPWAIGIVDGSSSTTTPGVGSSYCFTPGATVILESGVVTGGVFTNGNGPGTYTDSYVPPGNYASEGPLTNLNGCPLNGNWTITVTDHISSDNGYIFDWDLDFSPSFIPAGNFATTIASQGWTAVTTLASTGLTTANVAPTNLGAPCFNYSVTDNFGCTYTIPQCITVNCGFSLPVELISFEADPIGTERVSLRWITETEKNSNRFEIDRSADGENWEFVTANPAAGYSHNKLTYNAVDSHPHHGVSYYRLRSIDNDETEKISDLDVVTINPEEGILVIYPNPTTDFLTIEGKGEDLSKLRLINPMGQDITANVIVNSEIDSKMQVDISHVARGTYLIKTLTGLYLVVKQ